MNDPDLHPPTAPDRPEPELAAVVTDLAHIVHNASNLVLGHLAAIVRTEGQDRLDERADTMRNAMGRITLVMRALQDVADPVEVQARAVPLDELLAAARASLDSELTRRRVELVLGGAGPSRASSAGSGPGMAPAPGSVWADDRYGPLVVVGVLAWLTERIGADGCIEVSAAPALPASPGPPDEPGGSLELTLRTRVEHAPSAGDGHEGSLWWWVAERASAQLGASCRPWADEDPTHLGAVVTWPTRPGLAPAAPQPGATTKR